MTAPITVGVVDDQALVRTGFRMIIDAEDDLTVVGEAADGAAAIGLADAEHPDVMLMDVRMPDLDGIEATRRIHERHPDIRVLVLTTFDLDEYVFSAVRAGASGFLLKDTPPEELVRAVRVVAAGDALLSPKVTRRLIEEFGNALVAPGPVTDERIASLTERELEVLGLMARGLSNGEIAATLYLGETTVKTHVGRVLMKLGVRDRVQAVVVAYETGQVRPGS